MAKRSTATAVLASVLISVTVCGTAAAQSGRDFVYIVGSSTVYPFSTVVAERFGRGTEFKTPKVESTGSGGGLKLFCDGVGVDYPDVANSSRAIKQSEVDSCAANGVTEIVEVKIGYDGIVLANAKKAPFFQVTIQQLHLALAKTVPYNGQFIANPYARWSEISPTLPPFPIRVYGPPDSSGTRDAFIDLVLEGACAMSLDLKTLKSSDEARYADVCRTLREDGVYVDSGEDVLFIVEELSRNPTALGVFGFSFLDQNRDIVKGSDINGVPPTYDTIYTRHYPLSRALYFYVKKAHVGRTTGLRDYVMEFIDEWTWGPEGSLVDLGLIPMPTEERKHFYELSRHLKARP